LKVLHVLVALVFTVSDLNAAEYQAAEVTAPRSVEEIDTTLSNVSNCAASANVTPNRPLY